MDTAGNNVSTPGQQSAAGFAIPIKTAMTVASQISAGDASSTIVIGYPPFIGIYIGHGSSSNPQTQAEQQQNQGGGFGGGSGGSGGGFGGGFSGSGNGGDASCYTSDANLSAPSTIAPVNSGTLVLGTICGSPATSVGLTAGSVITSVNGQTVGSPDSLAAILAKFKPGAAISLTWVTPSGQTKTGTVTLTAGPPL
jgi:S1-C subfamily serine protease